MNNSITPEEEAAGLLPNVTFSTKSGSVYEVDPLLKRYRKLAYTDARSWVPAFDWQPYSTLTAVDPDGDDRPLADPVEIQPGHYVRFDGPRGGHDWLRTTRVLEVTR